LIPFSDGTSSIGAVDPVDEISAFGADDESRLKALIADDAHYTEIMPHYELTRPVGTLQGYSAKVKSLHGPGFALLGNAAEFLDPIFSSGVTIALKSASLAAGLLPRHLKGEKVDWNEEYAQPLMVGVDTFRTFVESWYEGTLQEIIMNNPESQSEFGQMIISILAGYAWDTDNLFVKRGSRLLPLIAGGVI
jgi:flavin-dependent dehydrogenase